MVPMSIDGVRAADGRAVLLTRREAWLQYPCAVLYGTALEGGAGNKKIAMKKFLLFFFERYIRKVAWEHSGKNLARAHKLYTWVINAPVLHWYTRLRFLRKRPPLNEEPIIWVEWLNKIEL